MGKLVKTAFLVLAISSSLILATTALAVNLPEQAQKNAQAIVNKPNNASPEGRMKACLAREEAIKNRSFHLTQLVSNMESTFDSIAQRVENYYTGKVIPSGKTVSNYDNLVANIATNKQAVTTALTKAQADASSFSCSNNPKAQLTQFRTDMQSTKRALKDYRTSIKDLIIAVHSVTPSAQPGGNK